MATVVPEPDWAHGPEDWTAVLEETLDGLLEITGATAGWVGLRLPEDPAGRLTFPVRRGSFPEGWLTLQQGQAGVWGLALRAEPNLVNELPPLPDLGEPALRNLLSCPLCPTAMAAGHIALGNKPTGFTSYDTLVVQTAALLLGKRLTRRLPGGRGRVPQALWQRALDSVAEGVLVLDEAGTLVYANATWERWTGFPRAELVAKAPPFPFWVSYPEWATLLDQRPRTGAPGRPGPEAADAPALPAVLPFRHRDGAVVWYQVETAREEAGGASWRVAFLRPPATAPGVGAGAADRVADAPGLDGQEAPTPAVGDWLALIFRADGTIDFWDERWTKLTGLSHEDLADARGGLVLDWLFPRQRDRDFVADLLYHPPAGSSRSGTQAVLEIMGQPASHALLCTFLQVGERAGNWLMLAGAPHPPEGQALPGESLPSIRIDPPAEAAGPHPKPPGSITHEKE
jgi:PAS domain S-box-containing protein